MKANHLKLNDNKTELQIPAQHASKIQDNTMQVGDSTVIATQLACDLGVLLDQSLTLGNHVQAVCKSAYYHLRMISSIRKCLDLKTTEKLIHAFVTSRLDCGNAVLAGLPKRLITKLQTVQNSAARVILSIKKSDHITPALIKLHF